MPTWSQRVTVCLWGLVASTFQACATPPAASRADAFGHADAGMRHDPAAVQPVGEFDIVGIVARGRSLFAARRVLWMAHERGLARVGDRNDDIALPIVTVDPGGASGQVLFVRWLAQEVGDRMRLEPARAQKWLLVSVGLQPDRVLDIEQVRGPVKLGSDEQRRMVALLAAAGELHERHPNNGFEMVALRERDPQSRGGPGVHEFDVVYAFAMELGGPDLVLRFTPVLGNTLPLLESATVVHEQGAIATGSIAVQSQALSPMTVARALGQAAHVETVEVVGPSQRWRVATGSGEVVVLPQGEASGESRSSADSRAVPKRD